MSILRVTDGPPLWAVLCFQAGQSLVKRADAPAVAYNLAGQLVLGATGWLILSVPNALVRGIYAAMHEPGLELPPGPGDAPMNAHVSVMRPEELKEIGGPEKVKERGKQFQYTLGRLYSVEPAGWATIAKAFFVRVHSPELQDLRRSYGLSSLPNKNKYDFHITVGIVKKGVLGRNEIMKGDPVAAGATGPRRN